MEKTLKTMLIVAVLILAIVVSVLPLSNWAMSPETYKKAVASIDDKTVTVLKLTATATLSSVVISALPDDTATPIADKLTDLTEYFMLTLVVLYAEKFLLTIMGAATFRVLIPIALVLLGIGMFWKPELTRKLALKLFVVGLALWVVIPGSLRVSDALYGTFENSITNTLNSAEQFNDETGQLAEEAGEDKGLLAAALDRISETMETIARKASDVLNRFVESLAVMIVTSCVIPLLVLLFFLWLIRQFTGMDLTPPTLRKHRRGHMPGGESEAQPHI